MFGGNCVGGTHCNDFAQEWPTLYEYLINVFETMHMKELTIQDRTSCLMCKMSKPKENESQGKDTAMVSHQNTADDPPLWHSIRMCFYYGKPGHIA